MLSVLTLLLEFTIKACLLSCSLREEVTELVDMFFIFCFSFSLFFDIYRSRRLKNLADSLLLGYSLRIFLLFFDRYAQHIFKLPNSGADSEMYYENALQYAIDRHPRIDLGFIDFMGTIFHQIGGSRLYGQFIVTLFSFVSLLAFAFFLKKMKLDETGEGRRIFKIVCLLPNFAILSSIFLRESVITMLIALSFFWFYCWYSGGGKGHLLLAFLSILGASYFHAGSAAVAIGYIIVLFLYDRKSERFHFKAVNALTAALFLGVFYFLYNHYRVLLFDKVQGVEKLSDIANMAENGGSYYTQYVGNSDTVFNLIIFTPLRIVFFLFSPFPFMWRGVSDIIAFMFSSLFYLYTSWCVIRFLRSKEKKNRPLVVALSIILICIVFVFAWGVSNAGTACRHRDKTIILWGALLALTYVPSSRSRAKKELYQNEGIKAQRSSV